MVRVHTSDLHLAKCSPLAQPSLSARQTTSILRSTIGSPSHLTAKNLATLKTKKMAAAVAVARVAIRSSHRTGERLSVSMPIHRRCVVARQAPQRQQSTWSSVVGTAKSLFNAQHQTPPLPGSNGAAKDAATSSGFGRSSISRPQPIVRDPIQLVGNELSSLRDNVSSLLGSGHPSLDTIAKYYFQAEGKHVRPLIVLLMARATNGISPLWPELLARAESMHTNSGQNATANGEDEMGINEPLSPREVLNDFNPHMEEIEGKLPSGDAATEQMRRLATEPGESHILPTQRRLAEITEMIHVASLLHDDVIDSSELRRGSPSAPAAFGNKLSILGGDFLLARASVALARLRNCEVVELLATVIANLVEGEVMQLQAQATNAKPAPQKSAFHTFWDEQGNGMFEDATAGNGQGPSMARFEHYLQKTYLKTAALIGKSARAATILGGFGADAIKASGCGEEAEAMAQSVRDAAYSYGRNVGIAFQLVDDLLDFRSTSAGFGKPSGGADLRLGLATAPVLFAWQQYPDEGLKGMVERKFANEGDVEHTLAVVRRSDGLARTSDLAQYHARLATEALMTIPQSEARDALQQLNEQIIKRVK